MTAAETLDHVARWRVKVTEFDTARSRVAQAALDLHKVGEFDTDQWWTAYRNLLSATERLRAASDALHPGSSAITRALAGIDATLPPVFEAELDIIRPEDLVEVFDLPGRADVERGAL